MGIPKSYDDRPDRAKRSVMWANSEAPCGEMSPQCPHLTGAFSPSINGGLKYFSNSLSSLRIHVAQGY